VMQLAELFGFLGLHAHIHWKPPGERCKDHPGMKD